MTPALRGENIPRATGTHKRGPGHDCQLCADEGWYGYCAPLRCYCGHETCPAFASWTPRRDVLRNVVSLPTVSSWVDREGSTWIDKM